MRAEITFEQVWYNGSLMDFFFRDQAEKTLGELIERAGDTQAVLDAVEDYANTYDYDLDSIEEMFYGYTVEELADEFEIELQEEEDEV